MRVVLAFDKFKGTFTARQICELIAEGIRDRNPKIEVIQKPMADGGDGSAQLLASSLAMDPMRVDVCNMLGVPCEGNIYWQNSRRLVVIESAEVLGISKSVISEENLFASNSWGFGLLLQKAFHLRPQEIWVCLGGTLTADLGWGIASAFGLSAYDEKGNRIQPSLRNMEKIYSFRQEELPEYMKKCKIVVLCDVNAPAIGSKISLFSFLKQKGASEKSFSSVEKYIHRFWNSLKVTCPTIPKLEDAYTGAGGGMCIGLSAVFPNAKLELGSQKIAKAIALESSFSDASFVVCGEGCLDELTLYGKTIHSVSNLATKNNVKLIGVFGKVKGNIKDFKEHLGFSEIITLTDNLDTSNITNTELIKISKSKLYTIGQNLAERFSDRN